MVKTLIFSCPARGASMLEVLLSMAIVAVAAPLVYNQISRTTQDVSDIVTAKNIVSLRDGVLNFVRINQDKWPDVAQIKLADDELAEISDMATAGFIDKYSVRGATVTDVYLGFDIGENDLRANRIARHIGGDAAVVGTDGVAYGNSWAVSAPGFEQGDIIYKISRDFAGEDKSKYLHRGTSGEDNLNVMERDLNMGGYNVLDVGSAIAESAKIKNASATFVTSDEIMATNVYFSDGANMDASNAQIGDMRVTGDITGFRNIAADVINGRSFSTNGRIITDRATVVNSVRVANDFVLKSDTVRTISGFTGIVANSVKVPFLSVQEMVFFEKFGLTVSGELMVSTTPPLKIGNWIFPSTTPPRFSALELKRANLPAPPVRNEFAPLMGGSWRAVQPKIQQSPQAQQ